MLGISNICKGYKSFVMKWNTQHKHSASMDSNDTSKGKDENDFIISYPSTPVGGGLHHTQSIDDSLLSRRTLSRNKSSRRCKTPTPRSFSRSMSRSTTPSTSLTSRRNPSETDILASITRNLSREAEIAASISRNISRNMSSNASRSGLSRTKSQNNGRSRNPSESDIPSPSLLSPPHASTTPASPSTARSPRTSKSSETDFTPTLTRTPSRRSTTPIVFSQTTARRKPPPVEKKLQFTLEELCHGCVKKIKITRDVINHAGIIVKEEETLKINVQPGWRKGTKITFEGKGDEKPGYLPADIIFLIDEKRHHLFKRAGRDDLEIAVEIPLADALGGCSFPAPLLGGEKMNLSFDEIIHHGYEKVIEGQGMPRLKEPRKRGDLRITCLVKFPKKLSNEQREEAVRILQDCSYQ